MHWGWAYDGVNASIPRNSGPECVNYLSMKRHLIECLIIVPLALWIFKYGLSKLPSVQINYDNGYRYLFGKQLLLITMTFLLGLEIGFKLCTRTFIYILNPCHITSMLQVYLLAAKPSKWTTMLFRIHINYMNGPLLAFLFPEHESRRNTFELPTYYLQHGLMFVIPIYLLRNGGRYYTVEKLTDLSYSMVAYGIFISYHFGILEVMALLAHVNLNHMICPAILDPFQGSNYRLAACTHQILLLPLVSKFIGYVFSPSSPNKPTLSELSADLMKWFHLTLSNIVPSTQSNVQSITIKNVTTNDSNQPNINETKSVLCNENEDTKQTENGCDANKSSNNSIKLIETCKKTQ